MQVVKTFVKDHPHMWWGLFLPLYLAAFFIIEKFVTGPYWVTQLPVDQLIPFCPYFIFFYMSWSPLLAVLGVYLILKDAEGFRRYIWMLALSFFSATVFCVLVPNCQAAPGGLAGAGYLHLGGAVDLRSGHQHQRVPQRPRAGRHRGGKLRVGNAGAAENRLVLGGYGLWAGHHRLYAAGEAACFAGCAGGHPLGIGVLLDRVPRDRKAAGHAAFPAFTE